MFIPINVAALPGHDKVTHTIPGRRFSWAALCVGALAITQTACSGLDVGDEDATTESALALAAETESAPPFTDATSTLVSGIANCMGSSMKCQIIRNLTLCPPLSFCHFAPDAQEEVIVAGGGIAGSPTSKGWRCGTSSTMMNFIEVYDNDPNLDWPSECVPVGQSFTMYPYHTYTLRGPSIAGGTGTALSFDAYVERLVAPSELSASANGTMSLFWTDNSGGEDGHRVERRYEFAFAAPANGSTRIGVAGYSFDGSVSSKLLASAAQFCKDKGHATQSGYTVASPIGGVHTWWDGAKWTISGNNSVYYLANVRCVGNWSEIATTPANTRSYVDALNWNAYRQEYRVRTYKGATNTAYSNVAGDIPKIFVGGF